MGIFAKKTDNLVKFLEGISLLEERDKEQIISVVDALAFAYEKENADMTGLEMENDVD